MFQGDGALAPIPVSERTARRGNVLLSPDMMSDEGAQTLWKRWRAAGVGEVSDDAFLSQNVLHGNALRIWFLRMPIPLFLMDVLDQLGELRGLLAWFSRAQAQLLQDRRWPQPRRVAQRPRADPTARRSGRTQRVPARRDFSTATTTGPTCAAWTPRRSPPAKPCAGCCCALPRRTRPAPPADDERADGLGLLPQERAELWQRVLKTARDLTFFADAGRYGFDESAREAQGYADELINNIHNTRTWDGRRPSRTPERQLWWTMARQGAGAGQ